MNSDNLQKIYIFILLVPFLLGIFLVLKSDSSDVFNVEKEKLVVIIDLKKDKTFPINKTIGSILILSSVFFAYYFYKNLQTKKVEAEIETQTNETPTNETNPNESLTVQESKIYDLIKNKYSNKEIAAELNISLSTVKTHVSNIYKKLKIRSRKQIIDKQ